jgi:hypothetical protein
MKKLTAIAVLVLMVPMLASAQDTDHQYHGQGYGFYGIGTSLTYPYYRSTGSAIQQVGFGGEGFLFKGLGLGGEISYVDWGGFGNQAWLPAVDWSYHLRGNRARARVDPFALGGVSVYVPTMHGNRGDAAGNFGGGVNYWLRPHLALRFEVRDTVNGSCCSFGPGNHYLSFRFGITFR